jgi:replication factor C subunit 2/4
LWIHDHAPTQLNQIIGNPMIIDTLTSCLKNNQIPNLIFCGPNGSGKTITAKILVQEYLGTFYRNCNMEIIGSIYRGKNVVTEKSDKKKVSDTSGDNPNIVNFTRKSSQLPPHKCRIVTIFDFDCMTNEAQMALRRIIEIYSEKVRFIFICNNLNKIIEALQSRTLILKFSSPMTEEIINRLKEISEIEKLTISDEIYQAIGIISNNDIKQAINYLQVFSNSSDKNVENFYHLFNMPSIACITQIIHQCLEDNPSSHAQAFTTLDLLIDNGYNVSDLLDIIVKVLMYNKDLSASNRVLMLEETIKIICLCEQSNSVIHLYQLLTTWITHH